MNTDNTTVQAKARHTAEQTEPESAPSQKRSHSLVDKENRNTVGEKTVENPKMRCEEVSVYYDNGASKAINAVSLDIGSNEVISMIGPSGCGKSTFIRCLNRMNDTIDGCRVEGRIFLEGKNIYPENPEEMASKIPQLIDLGVNIIGGCCGTTPAHIVKFREVINSI